MRAGFFVLVQLYVHVNYCILVCISPLPLDVHTSWFYRGGTLDMYILGEYDI